MLCDQVYIGLATLIDRAAQAKQTISDDNGYYSEVLQHLHACKRYCKLFHGRDELIQSHKKVASTKSEVTLVLFYVFGFRQILHFIECILFYLNVVTRVCGCACVCMCVCVCM